MRERPIIFTDDHVRAILARRKTQTRRVVNPQPHGMTRTEVLAAASAGAWRSRYGAPGDRLWVRETWAEHEGRAYYRAAGHALPAGVVWRPSWYLPRRLARAILDVKASRFERLLDISAADAWAEGVADLPWYENAVDDARDVGIYATGPIAVNAYLRLWDEINARRGYPAASNPLVVVVTFQLSGGTLAETV